MAGMPPSQKAPWTRFKPTPDSLEVTPGANFRKNENWVISASSTDS